MACLIPLCAANIRSPMQRRASRRSTRCASRLPVSANDIRAGLVDADNPGRFQVLPGRPAVILDVAHNPAAAKALAQNLARMPSAGRTLAVFAMLRDKDIAGVIDAVKNRIDAWFVAGTEGPRAADASALREARSRARACSRPSRRAPTLSTLTPKPVIAQQKMIEFSSSDRSTRSLQSWRRASTVRRRAQCSMNLVTVDFCAEAPGRHGETH